MDILVHYIIPFVGMLVALIVIHELGHYITAKLFGITVLEAGIGYPPRAWGFTWRGTIYSVNWLPLGGFVRLLGEEDPSDPHSLAAQKAWKRIIVLASGAGMNFVLPIVLFTLLFMVPRNVPTGPATISTVMPDSPAAAAGLKAGDIVLAVDGHAVKNTQELSTEIRLRIGQTIDFSVKRRDSAGSYQTLTVPVGSRWAPPDTVYTVAAGDTVTSIARKLGLPDDMVREAAGIDSQLVPGQQITVSTNSGSTTYLIRQGDTLAAVAQRLNVSQETVRIAAGLPDQQAIEPGKELHFSQGPTGITIADLYNFTEKESFSIWHAVPKGWTSTWQSLVLARNQVIAMFKGGAGPSVAGPVGIAQATGEVVKQDGWVTLLQLAALLSLNLGIINILPLPMLDGGRIFFVLIEIARRGKRIAPEKEAIVHLIGLALIITFAVVVTYVDIARIIGGKSLFS
jgi:Predicted membrane-associated Zn-dependent proteases 1